jgi:LmbE family N-acetylglucosaminyl deacetylase
MTNVAVIGCTPSDILSACQNTIKSLVIGGRKVYALVTSSAQFESSSLLSVEVAEISQLTAIGIKQTFQINTFDYSAITQASADAVNSIIKEVKPTLVIIPSWKSPDHNRKILARTSLIACRGIGTILMYELDPNNSSFDPTITFDASVNPSLIHQQSTKNNNSDNNNYAKEISRPSTNQGEIDNTKPFENKDTSRHKDLKTNIRYDRIQERFESHRTLLLEEGGLF